ncbi:hypothetical protein F3Y22_tig00111298pilonHSYRG00029 [Hibiscus syriacus]|uniref:Phorbol-ester/DAG-type domain-containing protein n=1 Tax=Hibiscus syriacus TaxID=106335 RepID=A0A6A2YRL2_HIBSY|nr:hypothetical protein F3Y22_tig00111298pilonHSYRG00029 [Hibiscus syriacus]
MVELHHMNHHHPLVFKEDTSSPRDTTYDCAGCAEKVSDSSYSAGSASFTCTRNVLRCPRRYITLLTATTLFFSFQLRNIRKEKFIATFASMRHQLLLVFNDSDEDDPKCSLCEHYIMLELHYRCVPCGFYIHLGCAWPPPIIEDKSHHDHPFTLFLKPNDPFDCNACGKQGNYVCYTCSTCNIQVHKDCVSLPRHIRLNLHPHPISHCYFPYIEQHDSRDWDCKICFEKVNMEHGSYHCSRPGCDFAIHVKCSIEKKNLYDLVEVENPDEFEEPDPLFEPMSCIIRIIKEIKVGGDVIAGEMEHISHKHNLIFSDDIKDNKCCNGCVLPILSPFYYCSRCDFFLHKACAELPRMCRLWVFANPFSLVISDIFKCDICRNECSGFCYELDGDAMYLCLRCASIPHSFTYHADEPHFIFFVEKHEGNCNACGEDLSRERAYRCKDCTFALHRRCVTFPRTASHKCDRHPLTLAYQDPDDYPLRYYCDFCEEKRDLRKWFYRCEPCDNALHIKCVLGEYPFIKVGSKYTYKCHPHPLVVVRKIYYYPKCAWCDVLQYLTVVHIKQVSHISSSMTTTLKGSAVLVVKVLPVLIKHTDARIAHLLCMGDVLHYHVLLGISVTNILLALVYQDPDDYPLRHYCDICEEERDLKQWFYTHLKMIQILSLAHSSEISITTLNACVVNPVKI